MSSGSGSGAAASPVQISAESDLAFVARLPSTVQSSYSCLVGRKDVLDVLKPMHLSVPASAAHGGT